MADRFKKVTAGAPLKIPAAAYNAFVDAAEAHANRQNDRTVTRRQFSESRNDLVLVKNSTGTNQRQSAILGLSVPIILPEKNLRQFRRRLAIVGVLPTSVHDDKVIILAEPIPKDKLGLGWVSGLCQAQVEFLSETETTAGIVDDRTSSLRGGQGAIPVLWKELGIGIKWAIVRLGGGAGSGSAVEHVVVREVFESTGNPRELVLVQAVDRNKDTGALAVVGPVFNAEAKPGLRSSDYFPWKWTGLIDQRLTRFLPCYNIRGVWRLSWEPDVIAEVLPADVQITDCIPASRAGGIP